ncbi:MAG: ABC transporter ATP-binding protein [Sphingobacteriaceae bacterium]|nr:ABC transporter ATP-binding protein [Sphingobacteriaceae bacterium]
MFVSYSEYLNEISNSILHADYSLASRRMLDFLYDYNLDQHVDIKGLSFDIRNRYLQQAQNQEADAQILKQLCEQWLQNVKQLPIPENREEETNNIVYTADDLCKEYNSGSRNFKLHPVSLSIKLGELTAVVGENGNGKTTLLRLMAGELAPTSGRASYFGNEETNWYETKGKIAYIPQRPDRWYGTLIDNLHFFCTIKGIIGSENEDHVNYILHRLGLYQFRNLKWTEISSGYRLRFELAKALMMRPRLLVLDEPLANLDINAQQLLLQDLKYLSQSSKHPMGVILSSQQLHELERNCKNIVFIKQGKTIYSGEQQSFAADRTNNAFEIGGNFSISDLQHHLNALGDIKIIDSGTVLIINTPLSVDAIQLLKVITTQNLPINYFRDISKSTRQLFQKDI